MPAPGKLGSEFISSFSLIFEDYGLSGIKEGRLEKCETGTNEAFVTSLRSGIKILSFIVTLLLVSCLSKSPEDWLHVCCTY